MKHMKVNKFPSKKGCQFGTPQHFQPSQSMEDQIATTLSLFSIEIMKKLDELDVLLS